jgi:ATP-binding cassette, subfamily B, bacterial MsbA
MKIYLRLISYIKKYKFYIVISILMSVLFSIFSALSIYLTIPLLKTLFLSKDANAVVKEAPTGITSFYENIQRTFENYIISEGKESALLKICILILIAFVLKNVTGFLQSIYIQYVEKGVLRDIRYEIYEKINTLSLRYFTQEKTGNLISRMTNDINAVQSGISAAFSNLIKDPLLIIIFLLLSISLSWQMTLMSVVVFPVTIIIITKIGASLKRRSMRVQQKLSEILTIITETIYGAKIIRAFRAESFRNKLFDKENNEHYKLILKTAKTSELTSPITEILSIFAGILIIWFGGREILINNTLKPEEFLGFLFILFQLIVPIKNLSTVSNRIQESSASGERIFEILDYPVEINEIKNASEINNFKDCIRLINVGFYYDKEKIVLENINLKINKSERIAIVGSSGVGKSTLADLIARFYDVTSGDILIDNENIKNIKIESLRKLIGIVPQETILFNDTIRNNIIFGMDNVSEEDLINATKFANAYQFILETENGFETIVGERGLKLSGGQKQRIAIARTILRNPQILILDEATSSLDTESEKLVQDALENLMSNRTSIIIAHRLSTVRNADRIVALDDKTVQQIGTHEELLKQENGIYKKLYELQFGN